MPFRTTVAATAVVAMLVPAAPAAATTPPPCAPARFTATTQADLVKVTALDTGVLGLGLPPLADVRLATAHDTVDSRADAGTRSPASVATGSTADARLLGLSVPVQSARATAPGGPAGPAQTTLAAVDAGGLATVQLGKSNASAHWEDAYRCGATGPLTRTATMLSGIALLGGSGRTPGIQAVQKSTGQGERTDLLRLGPTSSTQSAIDVVKLGGGRNGIQAGTGVALTDLTLFGGTPQEISVKVITQPTLTVVAGGDRAHSQVVYKPAVLKVTAAGKSVATLTNGENSVALNLFGKMSGGTSSALLGVRLSLGGHKEEINDTGVRAEAAALRVEVTLGSAHLLDVALGHLSARAATTPIRTAPATARTTPLPHTDDVPARPAEAPATTPVVTTPPARAEVAGVDEPAVAEAPAAPPARGKLALTGADVPAVAGLGLLLLVAGLAALLLVRRRRT